MPLLQATSEHTPTGNISPLFDAGVTGPWTQIITALWTQNYFG